MAPTIWCPERVAGGGEGRRGEDSRGGREDERGERELTKNKEERRGGKRR